MILPDKNICLEYSLFGCGALVLDGIKDSSTISDLWNKVRTQKVFVSYDKFLLTLDYLFMINAIEFKEGLILRCSP